MIYSYEECIDKFRTVYGISRAVKEGELFKVMPGIYSSKRYWDDLECIIRRYPKAIFTLQSAWYYHGLTDEIPLMYHVATLRDTAKIKDKSVKQYFVSSNIFEIGSFVMDYQGIRVPIYDKERMLIELFRNKNKLPFDLYKEVVGNYRNLINELNIVKIEQYLRSFDRNAKIRNAIQLEVF